MEKDKATNDFRLDFSKEMIKEVLRAFHPFKSEDNIRLSVTDKSLIFEGEELGNTIKLTISYDNIPTIAIDKSLFMSLHFLNQINQVCDDNVPFTFFRENEQQPFTEISVDISGTILNVGLPIYEKDINTDYITTGIDEALLSETIDKALKHTFSSEIRDARLLGLLSIGDAMKSGSTCGVSYYFNLFKKIDTRVSIDFRKYLTNLCKMGGFVKVVMAQDNQVVFINDNVEYKTHQVNMDFPNLGDTIDLDNPLTEFICGLANLKSILLRLSIAVQPNDNLLIKLNDGDMDLRVTDLQGRESDGGMMLVSYKGTDCDVSIPIGNLLYSVNFFDDDAVIKVYKKIDGDDNPVAISIETQEKVVYLSLSL